MDTAVWPGWSVDAVPMSGMVDPMAWIPHGHKVIVCANLTEHFCCITTLENICFMFNILIEIKLSLSLNLKEQTLIFMNKTQYLLDFFQKETI